MPPWPFRTRCSRLLRDPGLGSLEKVSRGMRMSKPALSSRTTPPQTVNNTPPTAVKNNHFDSSQPFHPPPRPQPTQQPSPCNLNSK